MPPTLSVADLLLPASEMELEMNKVLSTPIVRKKDVPYKCT